MIDINDIKERIGIKEGLEFYGLKFNKHGYSFCPFHREKKPSLYIYPKDDMFVCFSCGKKGDLIQFVQILFSLSFKDALEKVNDDFGLGLNKKRTVAEAKEYQKIQQGLRDAENRLVKEKAYRYDRLCSELKMLNMALQKVASKNIEAEKIIKEKISDVEAEMDSLMD